MSLSGFLAALTLLIFLTVAPCLAAKGGGTAEWYLQQNSDVHGPIDSYIGAGGYRLDTRGGLNIICLPPSWHVFFVNHANRRYYEQTMANAQKKTEWYETGPKGKSTYEKVGSAKIAGLPCTKYVRKCTPPGKATVIVGEAWVTNELQLPKTTHDAAANSLNIPPSLGVPLRLVSKNVHGVRVTYLDTLTARRSRLMPGVFKLPNSYTRVNDEVSLILDEFSEPGDIGTTRSGSGSISKKNR